MDRRDVLVSAGSVVAASLAGCSGNGGNTDNDGDDENTDDTKDGDADNIVNPGQSSAIAAVEAYWEATEKGDADRLNDIIHERHPLHPIEEPDENDVPESVEVSDIEVRDPQTVYSDFADFYEDEIADAAEFERTLEALVADVGADDYEIVYHKVLIYRPGDQVTGYRDPYTITVEFDGQWLVLANVDQLLDITSPA